MGDETMNDRVTFSFGTGVTDAGEPALQAVKRWQEDGEEREDRRTIDVFGMSDEAAIIARELNAMLRTDGLQETLRLAEDIARGNGQIQTDDERLFADGPPDPYTVDADRPDPVQRFRDAFADILTRPLEPVDPVVNYSFDLVDADPWTLELTASKWWPHPDGGLRSNQVPVQSYSMEYPELERELERERAALDREDLERTHREEGLEASMRVAEALAVASGELDPNREDGRLFREGPPDRFTTLREAELAGREHEAAVPERDEWQELLDRANDDQPEPEPHLWLLHHRPVETPDGEPLGTALVMVEFPQLTPDFGAYLEEHGM
ncbi:MAG: hypothetical protein IPK52_21830, partial [Chloroflexi bacterium]|nr:hypothetical protein [Chloroflexota bacterium]